MRSPILYELDPEIERTFRLRRKRQRIEEQRHEAGKNSKMGGGGECFEISLPLESKGSLQASLALL